jgi:hypothetical protein
VKIAGVIRDEALKQALQEAAAGMSADLVDFQPASAMKSSSAFARSRAARAPAWSQFFTRRSS